MIPVQTPPDAAGFFVVELAGGYQSFAIITMVLRAVLNS
jgi:hypothetical protein